MNTQKDILRVRDLINRLEKLDPETVVLYKYPELGYFGLTMEDITTGLCWFPPSDKKYTIQMDFRKREDVLTIDDHAHLGVVLG